MKYPEIDTRTKEDIINQIKELALAYTPEWHFDEQNKDVGTALVSIYTDMFLNTVRRLNKVTEKNQLAFFNQIGAKLLPMVPASGMAAFQLVNETVAGSSVKKGTKVLAQLSEEETKHIVFETCNDIYVTPARLVNVTTTYGEQDRITPIFNLEESNKECPPFLFFCSSGLNIQEHIFYFCQDIIFDIKQQATLLFELNLAKESLPFQIWFSSLLSQNKIVFEYGTEQGYVPFKQISILENKIYITRTKDEIPFMKRTEYGIESFWIRIVVSDIFAIEELQIKQCYISSFSDKIRPDLIYANGADQNLEEFYPFGERFHIYNEVYFGSNEVFGKKGAEITISFLLDYVLHPIEMSIEENEIEYKPIMKRSAFKKELEYEISINQVVFEYFNGDGWSRLFTDTSYSEIFSRKEEGEQVIKIVFTCPMDIQPILINSISAYFIRIRVMKVNNEYKLKGNYVSPIIKNIFLQYDYKNKNIFPDHYLMINNLNIEHIKGTVIEKEKKILKPFQVFEQKESCVFFGFDIPPLYGPIRILFQMAETMTGKLPQVQIEYSTEDGWNILNAVDGTENFKKTGIITMIGTPDFKKRFYLGKELYWIRFIDIQNQYKKGKKSKKYPKVERILMNVTEILAIETMPPEYFFIDSKKKFFTCRLLYSNIYKLTVFVDEVSILSKKEIAQLEMMNKIQLIYNENGELTNAWVKWEETQSFINSMPTDRHYIADKIHGTITFSDGKHGAIPPSSKKETIRIEYSCGGGEQGNLKQEKITQLESSLGFINRVYNPLPTYGGSNQELVQEALERNANTLKHGGRAITLKDYESIILETSRSILKVKCFSHINEFGKEEMGSITAVILQREYKSMNQSFDTMKQQIFHTIKQCANSNLIELGKFYLVKPQFLVLNISAVLIISDYNQIFSIKEKVMNKLEEFIHPITGNFDKKGFEIGVIPNTTQILNVIKTLEGIKAIKEIRLTTSFEEEEVYKDVDFEDTSQNKFILALNGIHNITVLVE